MFSIVHVILPVSDASPAETIRTSLAPFERGSRGDLPEGMLAFHDETAWVRRLHETSFVFTSESGGGLRVEGGHVSGIATSAIRAEMTRRGLTRWAVRFAEVEPDLDAFFNRYVERLERHPASGGFGRWLNPLGRWDWWDLGGRFDGRITGNRRPGGRAAGGICSGPNAGRAILANVEDALGKALGADPPPSVDIRADDNVEMVSRLLEDARAGEDHAFPGAVLLPPGSVEDRMRWLRSWPEVGPEDGLAWLGLKPDADWREAVIAAYEQFPDHWAAGVAYHL